MPIDAHSHLDKYSADQIDAVLGELEDQDVFTVSVAIDPASYRRGEAIASRSDLVRATFGIHPWEAPAWVDRLDEVEHLIERSPMIGEVGLDHRWVEDAGRYEAQRLVFGHFLHRAVEQGKVVNLHCSGAEADTLAMLRDHGCTRAIVHWYSGPIGVLSEMLAEGYLFTVGVEVLISDHIREVARLVPTDQLLTELDNPGGLRWLTEEVGMPHHLEAVVAEIGRLRGVEPTEVEKTVEANLIRMCSDDPHLREWADLLRS